MHEDLPTLRRELAILARRKRARVLGWPRDWRPSEVCNPEDSCPFTPAGAWEFIAEILEKRTDIALKPVTLDHPSGATGYVLIVPLQTDTVYIKLQIGAGKIIGRSFHYSIHGTDNEPRRPSQNSL